MAITSSGNATPIYSPLPYNAADEEIVPYVISELNRVSAAFDRAQAKEVEWLHVEPPKPREGMVRGADGVNWNPGEGRGLYIYYDNKWNKAVDTPGGGLSPGSVQTIHIADGAITTPKLIDVGVTTAKLGDISVTTVKIGDQAIVTAKIGDLSVTSLKLADGSIITQKLVDFSVVESKLANNSVAVRVVQDNAITSAKLVDQAVTAAKLGSESVTNAKVAFAAVTADKIAEAAVTTSKLLVGSVGAALNADPAFEDVSAWIALGAPYILPTFTTVTDGVIGSKVVRTLSPAPNGMRERRQIPYDLNKTYRVRGDARTFSGANPVGYIGIAVFNAAGIQIDTVYPSGTLAGTIPPSSWTQYIGVFGLGALALAADARFVAPLVKLTDTGAGVIEMQDVRIEEALPSTLIQDGAVITQKVAANAITTGKLDALAVTTEKLNASAVTTDKLNALAVTAAKIGAGEVIAEKIGALAVTTAKLDALAVTAEKVAAGAIVAGKIATAAIVAGDGVIANAAIGTALIIDANILQAKIADLAVSQAKIADAAITTVKILDGTITTAKIADAQITTAKIGALQVTTATIADLTVTTIKIANRAVTQAVNAFTSAEVTLGAGWTTAQTIAATLTGDLALVLAGGTVREGGGSSQTYAFRVRRETTVLFTTGTLTIGANLGAVFCLGPIPDTPSGGTYNYHLDIQSSNPGNFFCGSLSVFVMETKK